MLILLQDTESPENGANQTFLNISKEKNKVASDLIQLLHHSQ